MPIKNFQGKRKIAEEPKMPILVIDYMATNLITFSPEDPIISVMQKLIRYKISGAPVIDQKLRLVGMISEGDCLKQISESQYFNMPLTDAKVKDYMITEVESIPDNLTIFEVASLFLKTHRRRFPVLRKNKLLGQISRKDILKAALKLQSQKW